ncbi:MAG: MMPL family transporter, partial [candidate division Zixibacteria bacterium]|nr:MMPL family transporter [candidate division Zixibacteria bacterium]
GSPLFSELLVSSDGNSTLLQIKLKGSGGLDNIRQQIDELFHKGHRTSEEDSRLDGYYGQLRELKEDFKKQQAQLVAQVRQIREAFSDDAQIYLGGVPMIAADMISFVKDDLSTFSVGIVLLISACLWIFFRRLRWVLIPLGTTFVTILLMVGLLGFLNQPITAISSSFVSLLAIISISFTIHLIVRYRELRLEVPDQRHIDLVFNTMSSKLAPCLYTAITTTVAFASLMTSEILPLVDFGWIMVMGISISLMVTYAFFGSVLVLMNKGEASVTLGQQSVITKLFGYLTLYHPG